MLRNPKSLHIHPLVLSMVMLPLPPSVHIFFLPTTGLPENCEIGYAKFPTCCSFFFITGGAWIFAFMSSKVTPS